MGCAQAKPSMHSPPQGLEKLKLESGYVARGDQHVRPRRSTGQRPHEQREKNNAAGYGDVRRLSDTYRDHIIHERNLATTSEGKRQTEESNDVARTITKTTTDEEELIDGWPKWLVDNIPREALAGLVPKSADSYDKIDKVGSGTYSNVYKARDRDTGKIVALKKVRFDTSEPESIKFMAREIMILQKLDHPNIIKLEGLATSRMQYSLYIVFEYMQSDLTSIISRPDMRLSEAQIKCYMQQLLAGLEHCHERGILHRDIKGSNLLIDKNGMLKIADFGLANYFNPEEKRSLTSRVVTLWYRAPELLLGATDYGKGIDLWSAGCLMAEMFAGRPILPGRTEVEQLHKIFKLCGTPTEDYWRKTKLSTTFRPPYTYSSNKKEAFRHFPLSSWRLLNVLLALDPANRGSASSALQDEFFRTSPLACELSELPVVYKEEPETVLKLERRRHKTRQRSQSQKERKKKIIEADETKPDNVGSYEEPTKSRVTTVFTLLEPGSSTTTTTTTASTSSSTSKPTEKEESPQSSPRSTESDPNAIRNIKNRPPLPNARRSRANNSKKDALSRVQRSQSTKDFRHVDHKKLHDVVE
ncbi:probable serine/threonine-protein kinase At1g54610 [Nicotiana tomentosiformis]|uniref:probable serine/threonine-protein kinase At1g54610 n=1 Tax=Nicotiana tomentosiformis TaxID=4098 RepID=UPI00051B7E01|nr:probable serine/threonine-protein kinase At1g54610 [Nicotiana tomentosiformis]